MGRHLKLPPAIQGLVLALALTGRTVQAAIPHLVRYQGQAVDEQGVPLEGPYALTFRLYDAETGGTKVWEEVQADVVLTGGHFSVLLGQVTPLAAMDWGEPCWLSVQVGSEPELAPRQRITSVPLAIRAEVAETADAAKTADRLTTAMTTSTITDDANKLVPSGAVILWTGPTCPAGYTRLSALDGRFLVGGTAYNASAGGSNTHTHGAGSYAGPSHSHEIPNLAGDAEDFWSVSGASAPTGRSVTTRAVVSQNVHSTTKNLLNTNSTGMGSVTGISASTDSRPAFAMVLLCQKD